MAKASNIYTPENEETARREFWRVFNGDAARYLAGDGEPKILRKLTRLAIDSGNLTFEACPNGRYAFVEWNGSTPTLSITPV